MQPIISSVHEDIYALGEAHTRPIRLSDVLPSVATFETVSTPGESSNYQRNKLKRSHGMHGKAGKAGTSK